MALEYTSDTEGPLFGTDRGATGMVDERCHSEETLEQQKYFKVFEKKRKKEKKLKKKLKKKTKKKN